MVVKVCLFLAIIVCLCLLQENMSSAEQKVVSVDFEVFGRVQGVFFRKNTEKEAKTLGLKGWCMNTSHNTVKGVIEGAPEPIKKMKHWLQEVGSPSSRIDKAVFTNEQTGNKHKFSSFQIKK
ncbi:unnamed protein product [Phyllotreta striolata]|uniref:acylphosphatase n=1 Tax=Phyllotreta striolata TaxID=444603 RepID=A0A9N9TR01_PHYSR|nr:unnamed protein product [Phyllotreta striolata]